MVQWKSNIEQRANNLQVMAERANGVSSTDLLAFSFVECRIKAKPNINKLRQGQTDNFYTEVEDTSKRVWKMVYFYLKYLIGEGRLFGTGPHLFLFWQKEECEKRHVR